MCHFYGSLQSGAHVPHLHFEEFEELVLQISALYLWTKTPLASQF